MTTSPTSEVADPVGALARFVAALRAAGMAVDPGRLATAVQALAEVGLASPSTTYWALRIALCSSATDIEIFDAVFGSWWRPGQAPDIAFSEMIDERRAGASTSDQPGGVADGEQTGALASDTERLRAAAFDKLTEADRHEVNRLIALIRPRPPLRSSPRTRPGRGSRYDASRTARTMLSAGGDPAELVRRQRRTRRRRMVLLLDVSGSMTPYADVLLRFAHACVQVAPWRTEVFTMGTRLTRVTRELRSRDPDAAMRCAGEAIADWSGGTRLGESLRSFLDRWGQRGAARQAVVVIASDGWERGDAALLAEQAQRLARLATAVIWVNPHRGKPGFVAATAGMRAAAPYVDHLVAGHSLQAFDDLAQVIAHA